MGPPGMSPPGMSAPSNPPPSSESKQDDDEPSYSARDSSYNESKSQPPTPSSNAAPALGGGGGGASSRARALQQQRELALKKRQSQMNSGMMMRADGPRATATLNNVGQNMIGMRQFSAPKKAELSSEEENSGSDNEWEDPNKKSTKADFMQNAGSKAQSSANYQRTTSGEKTTSEMRILSQRLRSAGISQFRGGKGATSGDSRFKTSFARSATLA